MSKHLPAPTPEDIRDTADIVLGLRTGDRAEFQTHMAKASANPERYLSGALILLLAHYRGQNSETAAAGLKGVADAVTTKASAEERGK